MSMPTIPPQPHRPDFCHLAIDLLESIALEETALAHILNAEAEKIQAFLCHLPVCATPQEFIDFDISVSETMEDIIMKEWLLLKKFEKVTRLIKCKKHHPSPSHCHPHPRPPHKDDFSSCCHKHHYYYPFDDEEE